MQAPDRKVQVGAGMGGFTAVLAYAIEVHTGTPVPAEIAVAASTFLTFVIQYFVPNPS